MTTVVQVKRFMKPIIARNPDFIVSGLYVYLTPIRHVACGIWFQPSRRANGLYPTHFHNDLYDLDYTYRFMFDGRLGFENTGGWYWDNPERMSLLVQKIETETLPHLRSVSNLQSYIEHHETFQESERHAAIHYLRTYFYSLPALIANGDLDRARRTVREDISAYDTEETMSILRQSYSDSAQRCDTIRRLIPPLEANDIPALVSILREFEAITLKNLRVEPFWQRTPFPLEERYL